LEYLKQKLV